MVKKQVKFINRSLVVFLLIGSGNALLTIAMMFGMYEFLNLGYWLSSAIAFCICSIISFFLNKKYAFRNDDAVIKTGIKFVIVITVCYLIAFGIAKPIALWFLDIFPLLTSTNSIEKFALLVGQVVFTGLNYLGQRFFAFAKNSV